MEHNEISMAEGAATSAAAVAAPPLPTFRSIADDPAIFKAVRPLEYLRAFLARGVRPDGRAPAAFRPVHAVAGMWMERGRGWGVGGGEEEGFGLQVLFRHATALRW
jgi:hypothetical protein